MEAILTCAVMWRAYDRDAVLPGVSATYQVLLTIPEEESLCTVEFDNEKKTILQQTLRVEARFEFEDATDGRIVLPIRVVMPDEIPRTSARSLSHTLPHSLT